VVALSAGCGSTDDAPNDSEYRTVYVSAPLHGPSAEAGQAVVDGAKLALADAGAMAGGVEIRAVYLDDSPDAGDRTGWDPVVAAENAREAVEDASTIAYIGGLQSGATRSSLPITNQAGILQVSPGSTALDLVEDPPGSAGPLYQQSGRRSFGRVIPDIEALEEAKAPAPLPPEGRDFATAFRAEYGHAPDPYAAYGYEAMAVVLDSIERASDPGDRGAVIDAFFATEGRDSVLGSYSIDDLGNTTLNAIAGYVVKNGRPEFEEGLEAP
jgi:ABC-type branched-subunit amino acid transport system substrate-binding protein